MMMMPTESFNLYNGFNNSSSYNPCNCGKVMDCDCFSQISPRTNETWSSIAKSMGKTCTKPKKSFDSDRIIVPNVVYLMNLPQIPSIEDILKSSRFLGQYGRIERIIVHKNCTAHVTFATTTAAQICIQCLNNFYFDGVRISAKVGTTKYPQDVDLEKIALTNETEPPPLVCYNPVFPPPPFGFYNTEVESTIISGIDTSDEMPNIDLIETDQIDSLPISYSKNLDVRNMATLIFPLEKVIESEGGKDDDSLCIDDLMFGTGGVHNSVWSDEFPTLFERTQIRSSFVPRLGVPLLNLTGINTQWKPTTCSPQAMTSINIQSPLQSTVKSPGSLQDSDRYHSPRGIDELDLWDGPPSDLNYQSAEYSCPATFTSRTTNQMNDLSETDSSPSCSSYDYFNENNFDWQGGPCEYFQKDFIRPVIPCNSFLPEYHHPVESEQFYHYCDHTQSQIQNQASYWPPLPPPYDGPYPCSDYYAPRLLDFSPNFAPYQHIPLPEPCLTSWENPNNFL